MKPKHAVIPLFCGLLLSYCAATSSASSTPVKITTSEFETSLVAKGFVLQEKDSHIRCTAPLLDDEGKVHLFVSRWPVKDSCGIGWHTSCEIARYRADKPEGPYTFQKLPLTKNDGTIEDCFAFHLDGNVNLLVTDCHGEGRGGGMIYQSGDGITFDPKEIRAYEAVDHDMPRWPNPANGCSPWVLQRPALLLGDDGNPTHLFTPSGAPPEGASGTTTFLFEISKPRSL